LILLFLLSLSLDLLLICLTNLTAKNVLQSKCQTMRLQHLGGLGLQMRIRGDIRIGLQRRHGFQFKINANSENQRLISSQLRVDTEIFVLDFFGNAVELFFGADF
jgi:hypothetical protein